MPELLLDWNKLQSCWEDVAKSGFLTEGKYVRLLEEAVSERYGQHAVAMNSAGSGLFALSRVLGLEGHLSIVPANTFYATGAMPRRAGSVVRLADCAVDDFSMGIRQLTSSRAHCGYKPRAVFLTHVGGGLAKSYEAIARLCSTDGAFLIEDAAHAFGVKGVGSLGHAAVFSLYPTKAVPAGEGGIVITKSADLAESLRRYRNYGKYKVDGVIRYGEGFNLRMDEWTAAVAYLQTQEIDRILDERRATAERLMQVVKPVPQYGMKNTNWYKYPVSSDFPAVRQTGKIYASTDQLQNAMAFMQQDLPNLSNAEQLAESHICLPLEPYMYDGMTAGEIEQYLTEETEQ